MRSFEELDAHLQKYTYDSMDWAEYAGEIADEIVVNLSAEGWKKLQDGWRNKSLDWQKLAAGLLDDPAVFYKARTILIGMLFEPDEELTAEAARSLYWVIKNKNSSIMATDVHPEPDVLMSRLREIAGESSGTYEEEICDLIARLDDDWTKPHS